MDESDDTGLSKETSSIDNEPFYFESDTLALRNNSDYSSMLKCLVLLEAQRVRACTDLETLIELKEAALKDPEAFLCQLNASKVVF